MRGMLFVAAASFLFLVSCASSSQFRTGKVYEKVVTHKVSDEDTWVSIAETYYGDIERAFQLATYNGSGQGAPPEKGAGVKVPMTHRDINGFKERLEAVKQYNSGLELASNGRLRDASGKFREALKLDPSLSDASFNLAVTYQKLSLYKNAATVLRALIVRKKENPEYFYALGVSYFHMKEYKKAGRSFLDALSLDDRHLKSLFSLAVVHEKKGRDSEAERCWERYLEISGEGEWAEEARSRLKSLRGTDDRKGDR